MLEAFVEILHSWLNKNIEIMLNVTDLINK